MCFTEMMVSTSHFREKRFLGKSIRCCLQSSRRWHKEAVPVVEKLLEIARKHGVEGGVRTWCADDYVSIEGTGLGGWELHKCSEEYDMTYNKRVPLFEKENGEKTQ